MAEEKTFSESLFEEYLLSQGMTTFVFEKEWEQIPTHPDYAVYHNDGGYIFDVKEFPLQPPPTGLAFRDPYARIREKINHVGKQFKYFKDKSCCLVLYSFDPLVWLETPLIVFSAMYGDLGVAIPFDPETGTVASDSSTPSFLYRGKMYRFESSRSQNTTISALVTLRHVPVGQVRYRLLLHESLKGGHPTAPEDVDFDIEEKHPAVIVWENAFARIRFPRELFSGPYDERWGLDGNVITRVFAGEGVLACEELLDSDRTE
jgi:hypothetical protein